MRVTISFLSVLFLSLSPIFAADILKTNTGFYYPGNVKSSPYFDFDQNVPSVGCHLAKDYKLDRGDSVYAISFGVVEDTNLNLPFYGSDTGATGGALLIKHTTSTGEIFYGLYGHIDNFSVSKGDSVVGGQKIAEVGVYTSQGSALPHLHFGINTVSARYDGYTPTTSCSNKLGFVDPEVYITTKSPKVTASESCKATDDTASTNKNTIVTTSNVIANDSDLNGDTLVILSADANSNNGVAVINNNDGTFTYTPAIDFTGSDSFNYTITDNNGCTDQGKVTINIESDDEGSSSSGGSFNILSLFYFLSLLLMVETLRRRAK